MTDKEEIRHLNSAVSFLEAAINAMKEAYGFDQLASGYGAETYEETIQRIINGVNDYIIVA